MRAAEPGDGRVAGKALVRVKVPDGGLDHVVLIVHGEAIEDIGEALQAALEIPLKDTLKDFDSFTATVERVR